MGPGILISELLQGVGTPHALSTRSGGYSVGPFASLNFGNPGELPRERRDPPSNIAANFSLLQSATGTLGREIVQVHQVHGADVHMVRRGEPTHDPALGGSDTKADAIVTDDPARLLVIRVADCAPVLLASTDGRIVGAAHAGWRGAVAGVVARTIDAMRSLGATDIVAAIGPCIGPRAFEVGPEVAAEFRRVFGNLTPHVQAQSDPSAAPNKFLVDLKGALCEQATRAGAAMVDVMPHCTVNSRDERANPLFFSHRRDNGITGRMVGVIGARP